MLSAGALSPYLDMPQRHPRWAWPLRQRCTREMNTAARGNWDSPYEDS